MLMACGRVVIPLKITIINTKAAENDDTTDVVIPLKITIINTQKIGINVAVAL